MVLAWQKWCKLCGTVPRVPFPDLREEHTLLDVAMRCFSVSLERNVAVPVCPACEQTLRDIAVFTESCRATRDMLTELRKRKKLKSEAEMLEFRKVFLEAQPKEQERPEVKLEQVKNESETLSTEPLVLLTTDEAIEIHEEVDGNEDVEEDYDEEEEEPVEEYEEEVEVEAEAEGEDTQDGAGEEEEEEHETIDETWELEEEVVQVVQKRRGRRGRGETRAAIKVEGKRTEPKPPVRCDECHELFKLKKELNAHVQEQHPGLRKFICEECGKTFPTANQLRSHKVVHVQEPLHKCPQCPKAFKNARRMLVHQEVHGTEKYVCPECGLQLNTRFTYQRHLNVHSDVKSYKCEICSKLFKRQKTLKDHLIIHSGLRPYKCPFCERTFVNGPNCRSHKLKSHPQELAALESSDMNETVLENCRNIPTIQELIAISLQRINGGGSQGMSHDENNGGAGGQQGLLAADFG